MVETPETYCSKALATLGVEAIADFTTTSVGQICGALYPDFKASLFANHNWRFASVQAGPLVAGPVPITKWRLSYILPVDMLVMRNIYTGVTPNSVMVRNGYEIYDNVLMTDIDDDIYIDYTIIPDEDDFPIWFRHFYWSALAAELAVPVLQDINLEQLRVAQAYGSLQDREGGLYKQAKAIDARQQPGAAAPMQSLEAARRFGSRNGFQNRF